MFTVIPTRNECGVVENTIPCDKLLGKDLIFHLVLYQYWRNSLENIGKLKFCYHIRVYLFINSGFILNRLVSRCRIPLQIHNRLSYFIAETR
jgi:hypothetical protein